MLPEIITIAMSLTSPKEKDLTPSLGQFLRNGYPINQLIISRVTFFGDCPGEKIFHAYKISFREKTSINLGEDKYRRIKVKNMNTGGFTDRKYKNKP